MPPACANFAVGGIVLHRGGYLLVTITGPYMLLTRAEAAEVAHVSVERIRTWERRGHLERAGLGDDGQPVYTALDVARAEHKLRVFTRAKVAA